MNDGDAATKSYVDGKKSSVYGFYIGDGEYARTLTFDEVVSCLMFCSAIGDSGIVVNGYEKLALSSNKNIHTSWLNNGKSFKMETGVTSDISYFNANGQKYYYSVLFG